MPVSLFEFHDVDRNFGGCDWIGIGDFYNQIVGPVRVVEFGLKFVITGPVAASLYGGTLLFAGHAYHAECQWADTLGEQGDLVSARPVRHIEEFARLLERRYIGITEIEIVLIQLEAEHALAGAECAQQQKQADDLLYRFSRVSISYLSQR